MDFDASTGEFSNPLTLDYPAEYLFAHGVCFSGNSRYLYATTANKLFQFDTKAADVQASMELAGEISLSAFVSGQKGAMQLAKLGPDGKIYIVTPGLHRFLTVINRPNCPGHLCDFKAHSIELPARNYGGINNLPHFRVPAQTYDCDVVGTEEAEQGSAGVTVVPNPASSEVTLTAAQAGRLSILSTDGRALKEVTFSAGSNRIALDLLPGLYFFRTCQNNGQVGVQKVVIR